MPLLTNQQSRLLGGGRLPPSSPTYGAELWANGSFAAWTGDNPNSWTVTGESGSDPMVTQVAGGARIYSSGAIILMYQSASGAAAGEWLFCSAQCASLTGGIAWASGGAAIGPTLAAGANYFTFRYTAATFGLRRTAACDVTVSSMSAKKITLASIFSVRPYGTHLAAKAKATIVRGTYAGVVVNLDSATSPANFVIGHHDGVTARLEKCVGGTYTSLISTTTTYVAGAYVEVRRLAGTDTYQLFYNGSQVGTNQTISDAGITSNVLAGYMNTNVSNQVDSFFAVAT